MFLLQLKREAKQLLSGISQVFESSFDVMALHVFFDTILHVSTQMVLFEKAQFSGQAHEIFGDVADATSLRLSPLVSVMVVRGW